MAVNGCNGIFVREDQRSVSTMFDLVPPNPKQITTLHSLSVMKACLADKEKYGIKEIFASPMCKALFSLELYLGFFFRLQYDANSLMIRANMMLQPPTERTSWIAADEFLSDDYFYVDNLSAKDLATIKTVIEANNLCRMAAEGGLRPQKLDMVRRAQLVCPSHCPLAHLLKFESLALPEGTHHKVKAKAGEILVNAVQAGRALVALLQDGQFCEGNLFSYEPTRNYIRALYIRGCYLLYMGNLEDAYNTLQECLANDIHDKLGACHKQLLVVLEVGIDTERRYDERLPVLLEASFGDDQEIDDILALWNYTRALYNFLLEGATEKSNQLLVHAMDRNPFVPPLFLRYESVALSWLDCGVISVGHEGEANDYVMDNVGHWKQIEGSLMWLRNVYFDHEKAMVPNISVAGGKLLSKGNKLFTMGDSNSLKKAIVKYKELLKVVKKKKKYAATRLLALERIGCCYKFLGDHESAMQYFNEALSYSQTDLEQNKNAHKEILYQVADCKDLSGDYDGALDCYKQVFDKIGPFNTAMEQVRHIEQKIGRKSGVIPVEYEMKGDPNATEDPEEDAQLNGDIHDMMSKHLKFTHSSTSNYHEIDRCHHCKRGRVKLSFCALCRDYGVKYCSKSCQTTSWHQIHKYTCTGSKFKLEVGTLVQLKGLESSSDRNGMQGKVVEYSEQKRRFVVHLTKTGAKILADPHNLEEVAARKSIEINIRYDTLR